MKIITNNILNKLSRIFRTCENFVFFDTSKPDSLNTRSFLFLDPIERMQFYEGDDETVFLAKIQELQRKGLYMAGWFSYEFGYLLEPSLRKRLNRIEDKGALLADFGVFTHLSCFEHDSGECNFPFSLPDDYDDSSGYSISEPVPTQTQDQYIKALQRILDYIEAGDTYQVNYTLKLNFSFRGSFEDFYRDLRRNQSVSYGAYIRFGESRFMSFSPELFFRKKDNQVIVRPMKGTVKRGKTAKEDEFLREYLRTDLKNRSENVMIVDLLRNDLGRLMHHLEGGDVTVNSLFDVETYETLLQMTSTITGKSGEEELASVNLLAFLKAIFPCGSVTGAPKIRTMEIIDDLEKQRRGIYTGAIGYIMPDGESVFNVPIRTVAFNGDSGEMGIGSGIVHDSNPVQEWEECLLKGRFLTSPNKPFRIIETVYWNRQSGYYFLMDHLERLQETADYFLFACDLKSIRARLEEEVSSFGKDSMRIRLLLAKDGYVTCESCPCPPPGSLTLPKSPPAEEKPTGKVAVSSIPVDSHSCWLYHKTTHRALYSQEYEKASKSGLLDVIFENELGYITEGCISNVIIYLHGEYLTPPVADGLLAGVMRKKLLDSGETKVIEKSLKYDDLLSAEAVYICNSVKGITRVVL